MEPKNSKIFNKEIMQAVSAFCESQEIKDVDQFMYLCFKQGFDIKRYGFLGKTLDEGEKDLIKEVIVEKRVEVPVEIIKEVEIVKEIPVEKEVIKEVVKEIYITDDLQVKELGEKIDELEKEKQIFSTMTTEMENFFQREMSKKDDEIAELRQSLDISVDKDKMKLLQDTLQSLRNEIQKKNQQINELEKINRELNSGNSKVNAILLRGSNLNNRI